METKGLEYFISVYDCGSIMTAAEKLFISPQGLSKAIGKLEGEVCHELFVRSNRGVVPTDFARRLYPVAHRIVALVGSIAAGGGAGEEPGVPETLNVVSASGYLLTLG